MAGSARYARIAGTFKALCTDCSHVPGITLCVMAGFSGLAVRGTAETEYPANPRGTWQDFPLLSFPPTAKPEYAANTCRSWQDFPVLPYSLTSKPEYPASSVGAWQDIPVLRYPLTAKPENHDILRFVVAGYSSCAVPIQQKRNILPNPLGRGRIFPNARLLAMHLRSGSMECNKLPKRV